MLDHTFRCMPVAALNTGAGMQVVLNYTTNKDTSRRHPVIKESGSTLLVIAKGFAWTKTLPRKTAKMRGKLFVKRKVFVENRVISDPIP